MLALGKKRRSRKDIGIPERKLPRTERVPYKLPPGIILQDKIGIKRCMRPVNTQVTCNRPVGGVLVEVIHRNHSPVADHQWQKLPKQQYQTNTPEPPVLDKAGFLFSVRERRCFHYSLLYRAKSWSKEDLITSLQRIGMRR